MDIQIPAKQLGRIACIFSVELSRNLAHPNPASKMFIMTAQPSNLPASTAGQLALVAEGSEFIQQYRERSELIKDCRDA